MSRGLSQQAVSNITASLRPSTQRAYLARYNAFLEWCSHVPCDPLTITPESFCSFLDSLSPLRSGSIELHVSAITTIRRLLDSSLDPLSTHPLIKRYVSGLSNTEARPPPPTSTWDIQPALQLASSWFQSSSLKEITWRTSFLLAITTGWRPRSDLGRILYSNINFTDNAGISLGPCPLDPTITPSSVFLFAWKPKEGDGKRILLQAFPSNLSICPVMALLLYTRQTLSLRGTVNTESRLFLSISHPHQAVSEDTVGGWVQSFLRFAGIHATAHSTRATATTLAFQNSTPLQEILRAANWSSNRQFFNCYLRGSAPLASSTPSGLTDAILSSFTSNTTNTP